MAAPELSAGALSNAPSTRRRTERALSTFKIVFVTSPIAQLYGRFSNSVMSSALMKFAFGISRTFFPSALVMVSTANLKCGHAKRSPASGRPGWPGRAGVRGQQAPGSQDATTGGWANRSAAVCVSKERTNFSSNCGSGWGFGAGVKALCADRPWPLCELSQAASAKRDANRQRSPGSKERPHSRSQRRRRPAL